MSLLGASLLLNTFRALRRELNVSHLLKKMNSVSVALMAILNAQVGPSRSEIKHTVDKM